jgi:hypothetical protein
LEDATEGVRLQGVSKGRVIPAAVPMIHQPQAAVKPLGGEELPCQGDGQGAGQDAAVGVVPQVALAVAIRVADGQYGVGGVGVEVVEGAVHAGDHPSTLLRTGPLAVGVVVLGDARNAGLGFGAGRVADIVGSGEADGVDVPASAS